MKQTNAMKRRGGLFAWACLFVLLLAGSGAWAQSRPVTGVVSDANGPMAGCLCVCVYVYIHTYIHTYIHSVCNMYA